MATPRVINKQLDPAILQQMEEPITVSVSRVMGGARTPLLLPSREDGGVTYGPGEGWDKTSIQHLEGWIVTDFAGGGLYNIKIVDTKGLAFEWQPYFDPKTYPIKVPYTMQSSMPTASPQAVQTTLSDGSSVIEWPPRNLPSGIPFSTPIPSQVPMSFPMFPYSNVARVTPADEDRRRHEDNERALRDQLAAAERARLEEKHRADLAARMEELKATLAPKTDDAASKRLDKLEAMMERVLDKLSAPPPAPTGPSPELLAMQEQNRKLEAKLEEEARDRRHREEMAAMERRIEALAARPTGPDPMIMLLTETMKDERRSMQSVLEGMNRQMLTPQDVLNLAKSTSSGLDDLRTGVVRTFQEIFELQKRAFESAAQMLPQGESPAIRVIEGITEKASDAFSKWQESKDAAQIANAKATAAQARTAEASINAQREQLAEMARREENLRRAQGNVAHQPSRVEAQIAAGGNGLAGASVSPDGQPSNVIPLNPNGQDTTRRLGKTDAEWFQGVISHVERLRVGVDEFLDGIQSNPPKLTPDGKPVGVDPEKAASFVLQSVETLVQGNFMIPAFTELYIEDRLEDFAMVLLPNAPMNFRQKMIEAIEEQDGDGDEDEDEAPDEKPDAKAEATQQSPAPKVKGSKPPRPPQPRA